MNAERRPRRAAIEYLDRRNVSWRVTERDTRHDPGARGDSCLVFSSDGAIRRVWTYPANWQAMSDSELEALSWSTHAALRLVDDQR